jgi:hypothetical protein
MIHQDIVDLISAGKFEEAEELFRERNRRGGVSGHDAQIMQAVEKKVRARLATVVETPPLQEVKAKKPSKTPRRTRRRKEK